MKDRHSIITYTLEEAQRPGAHEICIRRPPDGIRIRNREGGNHAESSQR